MHSTAEWPTENGRKYLVQLCKHFAHKVEVSYSESHGECRFSCGTVLLHADDRRLRMEARSPDLAQLADTESVIERHLIRFAFRDNLQQLAWHRSTEPAPTNRLEQDEVTS